MAFNRFYGTKKRDGSRWEDGGFERGQSVLQPKLKLRYRVLFSNFGTGNFNQEAQDQYARNIQSIQRPGGQTPEVPVHALNSVAWVPGKHEWNPIQMVMKDDVDGRVSAAFGSQMMKQFNFANQAAYSAANNDYKFDMGVTYLDGDSVPMETWVMMGCFFQTTDNDQMDYAASEIVNQTLTIRFDNAVHGFGQHIENSMFNLDQLFDSANLTFRTTYGPRPGVVDQDRSGPTRRPEIAGGGPGNAQVNT